MVITTSAACTISTAKGLGNSEEMSIPTSRIASTAAAFRSAPGIEPPEYTSTRPFDRWRSQPAAICDRPALCTHTKSTVGSESVTKPCTFAIARSRSSAYLVVKTGMKVRTRESAKLA
jgi:hypothetical protein